MQDENEPDSDSKRTWTDYGRIMARFINPFERPFDIVEAGLKHELADDDEEDDEDLTAFPNGANDTASREDSPAIVNTADISGDGEEVRYVSQSK